MAAVPIESLNGSDAAPVDLVATNELHAVGLGCQVRSGSPPKLPDRLEIDLVPADSLEDPTASDALPIMLPTALPSMLPLMPIAASTARLPLTAVRPECQTRSVPVPRTQFRLNALSESESEIRSVPPPVVADTLGIDLAPVDSLIENLFASDDVPADLIAADDLHPVGLGCQARSDSFASDGFSDGGDDVADEAEVSPIEELPRSRCMTAIPDGESSMGRRSRSTLVTVTRHLSPPETAATSPLLLGPRRSIPSPKHPALWFELTESFDQSAANESTFGYEFDVQTLGQIAQQFSKNERLPEVLRKELTEDLGSCQRNWDDSEFGFSDEQLETLWKRFGSHMGGSARSEHGGSQFSTPAPKTFDAIEQESSLPCTDALNNVEEAMENIVQSPLRDFIGEALEHFIGTPVPHLPSAGMLAWMISAHCFDGEDWYLFKVTASATNRFYMKTFADLEELHATLEKVSERGLSYSLPQLAARDYFGMKRFFGGADFGTRRMNELRTYVSKLMSGSLTPWQEQVVRLFFGPSARGRILPPKGQIHRGLVYGS